MYVRLHGSKAAIDGKLRVIEHDVLSGERAERVPTKAYHMVQKTSGYNGISHGITNGWLQWQSGWQNKRVATVVYHMAKIYG